MVLGFTTYSCPGQISRTDTAYIKTNLKKGQECLARDGKEKLDLDSALQYASQAAKLSRQLGYVRGIEDAALLTAGIHDKKEEWTKAWALFTALNDTSRISFLTTMILYRILYQQNTPACVDSAAACISLLEPLMKNVRTVYSNWRAHAALINYYMHEPNKKHAADLTLRGFQFVRHSGDIFAENEYVFWISASIAADSALIPMMTSVIHRTLADDDSLLAYAPDEQQQGAIFDLAKVAINYYYNKQISLAIYLDSMAVQLNERLHQHVTRPYGDLSFLYANQGKTEAALALAFDAIRVAETPAGPLDAIGYETASRIYYMMGNYDKCLEYFYKALPIIINNPEAVNNAGAVFSRGVDVLLQKHNPNEALRVIQIIRSPSHSFQLDDRGKAYTAMALANCFFALGQRDSAERYYAKSIALVRNSYGYNKIMVYGNVAAFYTATGQYIRARPLLDTLTADSLRPLIAASMLEKDWFLRYEVDSALHNYPGALTALRSYQLLHDSLTNDTKNKQVAEMDVKYETDKKNQHITDLEKQTALQTSLRQAAALQNRIVRNSLIAGATLLALLAGVLYNRWRVRRRMSLRLEKLSGRQQKLLSEKEKLLSEKEWLLREIHKPVKNNLQISIRLLTMQTAQPKGQITISAFQEIGARVNTISLVHKKLYQETADMASIDMREYIRELVAFLNEGLGARQAITFNLHVQQLVLDPAQCVPVGLILNEAITNAIKYAFQTGMDAAPNISISVKEETENYITLVIADNGAGLPPGFDPSKTNSLGLQLIQTLTLQLEGTLEVTSQKGLTITIIFPWVEPMAGIEKLDTAKSARLHNEIYNPAAIE